MLLDTGKVDVDSRDRNNRSPLSWAAENGHKSVVKMLLDTGKVEVESRDTRGRTALFWAARKGRENTVSLLVNDSHININSRDNIGYTPFMSALARSHYMVVKVLSQSSCSVEESCKEVLAFQAFNLLPAAEFEQFLVDIGYAAVDDLLGLQALFYRHSVL
ncbi:ankyrin [Colletotrichum somersetense]|nr:ankyrin [Colletotrichum somersetense]